MDFVLFLGYRLKLSPHEACQRLERALENYKPHRRYRISLSTQEGLGEGEPPSSATGPLRRRIEDLT